MANVLIPKTTAAYTSLPFSPINKNTVSLCCNALQNSETITLQVYDLSNAVWVNAQSNGQLYQITATSNFMTISNDAQRYRVVKSVTANAVGLDTLSDINFNGLPLV